MSVDGTKLLFEGFLQKRKDTMKIKWTTYWFRLQNTTLFFYTKKNGNASHLRGYYYIYTVQSVREVNRDDNKRYMFEIMMTNGKRKMLAAETADLRKEWVGHLWKAMHLSNSVVLDSRNTYLAECDQRERNSSNPICSDNVMEMLPARPLSAPAPPNHIEQESWSIASSISTYQDLSSEEEPTYQNTMPHCGYQNQSDSLSNPQWSSGLSNTESRQEGDYDVLPLRNKMCEINTSAETEEGVYDYPLSYRMTEHQVSDQPESIYDVPSSLRRIDDTTGKSYFVTVTVHIANTSLLITFSLVLERQYNGRRAG
ncbi:uncharacterized protein LOC113152267 isoform X2 [Anabas testudineus]|uniref:uncharacterized protein LOC113152267 isoform X2 n=1 Tax=Anabas testudineus TaxID=64144 RepID=UPI000E45507A|nr:uncharacterized protein LOC113152267 isoform X2 [Anabas testudineus]